MEQQPQRVTETMRRQAASLSGIRAHKLCPEQVRSILRNQKAAPRVQVLERRLRKETFVEMRDEPKKSAESAEPTQKMLRFLSQLTAISAKRLSVLDRTQVGAMLDLLRKGDEQARRKPLDQLPGTLLVNSG
ncbi:MAG: hypothetical protein M1274_14835, partial [Actinobacteria bacterium]|nr:hypothetical protein [Actinomycetota bacterium]